MKFDKHKDPAACAAKDETPYAVHAVAVVEKGDATFLAATDGRMATLVRCYAEDGDDLPAILGQGRIYPPAAFVAARKGAKRKDDASLVLNGSAYVQADGATTEYPRPAGTFPDVFGAVPKAKPAQVLRLNAEFLARMQKALGANGVAIEVHALEPSGEVDPSLPFTIRPLYMDGPGTEDGSFGILMPIRGD